MEKRHCQDTQKPKVGYSGASDMQSFNTRDSRCMQRINDKSFDMPQIGAEAGDT